MATKNTAKIYTGTVDGITEIYYVAKAGKLRGIIRFTGFKFDNLLGFYGPKEWKAFQAKHDAGLVERKGADAAQYERAATNAAATWMA